MYMDFTEHEGKKYKQVFCIPKHEMIENAKVVKVWNDRWQNYDVLPIYDFFSICPMCETPIHVKAIIGSSYSELCSPECTEAWRKKYPYRYE